MLPHVDVLERLLVEQEAALEDGLFGPVNEKIVRLRTWSIETSSTTSPGTASSFSCSDSMKAWSRPSQMFGTTEMICDIVIASLEGAA